VTREVGETKELVKGTIPIGYRSNSSIRKTNLVKRLKEHLLKVSRSETVKTFTEVK